jgi:hypothetical protein
MIWMIEENSSSISFRSPFGSLEGREGKGFPPFAFLVS